MLSLRHSTTLKREQMIERSRLYEEELETVRKRANRNGNEYQLELLEEKFRNNLNAQGYNRNEDN